MQIMRKRHDHQRQVANGAEPKPPCPVLPGEEEKIDWTFGNPLTFNDARARKFGRARFGHGEGFHGTLVTRFGLLKHKAWYRRREQAQRDFLMVFCGMHALAMEQRARLRKQEPAGLPVVATIAKPPAPEKGSKKAA